VLTNKVQEIPCWYHPLEAVREGFQVVNVALVGRICFGHWSLTGQLSEYL